MAPHSSTLAWKIPWTQEPGRLQSMGSLYLGKGRQNLTSPRCRPKNFTLPTASFPRGLLFMGLRPPALAGSLLGGRWSGLRT